MGYYRKRPVIIEARKFEFGEMEAIAFWCGGRVGHEAKPSDHADVRYWIDIPTLEGVTRASLGDFVIKGVQGEFYACKPDIFEETYEPVKMSSINLDTHIYDGYYHDH